MVIFGFSTTPIIPPFFFAVNKIAEIFLIYIFILKFRVSTVSRQIDSLRSLNEGRRPSFEPFSSSPSPPARWRSGGSSPGCLLARPVSAGCPSGVGCVGGAGLLPPAPLPAAPDSGRRPGRGVFVPVAAPASRRECYLRGSCSRSSCRPVADRWRSRAVRGWSRSCTVVPSAYVTSPGALLRQGGRVAATLRPSLALLPMEHSPRRVLHPYTR